MTPLDTIIQKFEQIPDIINKIMFDTCDNAAIKELVVIQVNEQMEAGVKSDGKEIEPPYHPITEQIKAAKGQPFDRVTLKNTGKFRSEIFAETNADGIQTGSKDEKTEKLKYGWTTDAGNQHPGYGEEIFGLTPENQSELKTEIVPFMLQDLRSYFKQTG